MNLMPHPVPFFVVLFLSDDKGTASEMQNYEKNWKKSFFNHNINPTMYSVFEKKMIIPFVWGTKTSFPELPKVPKAKNAVRLSEIKYDSFEKYA